MWRNRYQNSIVTFLPLFHSLHCITGIHYVKKIQSHCWNSVILLECYCVTLLEICCITRILLYYQNFITLSEIHYINCGIPLHITGILLYYWKSIILLEFSYITRILLNYKIMLLYRKTVMIPEICYGISLGYVIQLHYQNSVMLHYKNSIT